LFSFVFLFRLPRAATTTWLFADVLGHLAGGFFVSPTIITGASDDMEIAKEEVDKMGQQQQQQLSWRG